MKKHTLRIFSRHPSHKKLREAKLLLPHLSLIRFGSTTKGQLKYECEINSIEGVQNSANKLRMKKCFTEAGCHTADWWIYKDGKFVNKDQSLELDKLPYPIVSKSLMGSRGRGNIKHDTLESLKSFISTHSDLSNYIFEKFYSYTREYRLHVSNNGCFYTCRKMIKQDTPEDDRWRRHEDNCVWIVEDNPVFDKPQNWNDIVEDCKKALNSLGLDVAAFDVKIQSPKGKKDKINPNPDWIILESNSAPAMGEITPVKYLEEIPKIVELKMQNK